MFNGPFTTGIILMLEFNMVNIACDLAIETVKAALNQFTVKGFLRP